MRNNEYTATPNWFKQESTDSLASIYQTNYYLTGSTSSGSGISSINLYNKYIINTYRLTVDDLFIPNTAIIAVDSELPEGLKPSEDFVSEVGNNVEATNWHTSYLISVVSGTNLIANLKANSNRYGIVFYDEYNQPISGYTPIVDELATIPVPENARYFRCCHYIEPVVESVEEPVEPTYEFYIEYTGMGNYEDSDLNTAYGGIFENFTNVNSSVPEGINTKLLSTSGLNLIFQQPLSCTVDKSNNIKIGLDKVFTDSKVLDLWKLIEDEQGNKYIITDYNIVGKGGITAYYNDDLNPGGDGGLGGGGSIVNIQIIGEGNVLSDVTLSEDKSLLTFTKSKIEELDLWKLIEDEQGNRYIVTDYNIVGRGGITAYYDGDLTPGSGGGLGGGTILDIEIKGEGNTLINAYLNEDKSILNFDRGYLMDLTTEQTSTALKTFTEGIKIGDTLIKVIDGVLTLDCSLAVTGGITAYALGEQIASSIMDAIICDGTTITVIDGKLTVIGGTGGASNWDELEGKPSWITNTKPTYTWSEITNKPNTLYDYGILASDILNTIKSVDGSGSGLDADTLDGIHANGLFTSLESDTTTNLSITIGKTTKSITDLCANSAAKLQTARTIWGQRFDGTANVTGSLTSVTDITGTGTFTGANIKATDSVYVNGIRLHKTVDGAVTIEGNLLVTGGITAYADGEDSGGTGGGVIVIDNLTSTLTDAALSANQGRVLKDLIDSKVSNWGELEGKPTTIAGYGITDAYTKTECNNRFASKEHNHPYLPYQDTRDENYNPYDNNFNEKGLSATHLKTNTVDGLNDGGTYHTSIYLYPWRDRSAGSAHNLAFTNNGNMWLRSGTSSWNSWKKLAFTTDNVASATNADKLDGVHLNGIFTAFTTNGNNTRLTIGGVTKDLTVPYASNADMLDGVHNGSLTAAVLASQGNKTAISGTDLPNSGVRLYQVYNNGYPEKYGNLLSIKGSGCGELLLAWKNTNRIYYRSRSDVSTEVWQEWSTVAFLSDNVASATKLQTARTIWGQSFDGTNNVSGRFELDGINSSTLSIYDGNTYRVIQTYASKPLAINPEGNRVGIGLTNPAEALHVSGNIAVSGYIRSYHNEDSWLLYNMRSDGTQKYGIWTDGFNLYFRKDESNCMIINAQYTRSFNDMYFNGRIIVSGNAGIGTSSPSQKLHVVGNILSTGGGTFYSSDIRAKTIIERPRLSLNSIANAPVIKFRWNGYNDLKDDGKLHIGGIAQYIEKILPECVIGQKDDFLSFDYATVGYVFSVQTARHLQSYETKTDREIKKLKNRITFLEKQLKKLGYEEVDIVAD